MSGGKGFFGCLSALAGMIGIFVAITISFTFYLIPVAFILFIVSLIMISLALGPSSPADSTKNRSKTEIENRSKEDK
ncbi:MAG: hypothetical protein HY036_11275 [Nitrospirae bacterium]|nr:hypothetical protein [Nitrospirota bacterium]MBI3353143.1 hypothetical protein [Nitrospirota bacterium]